MKLFFAAMALHLVVSTSFAESAPKYNELNTYNRPYSYAVNPYQSPLSDFSNAYIRSPVPLDQEMSFDTLNAIIKKKNLIDIADVIHELPDAMKNDNYVLMYRSRSLQDASPESPRAILFTPTASFIVSFNGGGHGEKGANTLEAIQFRYAEKRFEFRELSFDGKSLPRVSAANPAKCLSCHQSPDRQDIDPRPNWEPYSVWIGAFGSNHSNLNVSLRSQLKPWEIEPQDKEILDQQEHEVEMYSNFSKNIAPKNPRFSQLGVFRDEATAGLTQDLTILDFMRVTRQISADPEIYPLFRETLAGAARCDSPYVEENPVLQWMLQFKYPQYTDKTTYDNSIWGPLGSTSNLLTYLFEAVGIDTSDWSMDFGSGGRLATLERFGTPTYTRGIFKHSWSEGVPDAAPLSARSCDDLYSQGLGKLNQAYADGTLAKIRAKRLKPAATGADILARCVKCHVDSASESIPALPFDDLAVLSTKLSQPFKTRGSFFDEIQYRTSDMATQDEQMPRNRRLTKAEREVFIAYLRTLQQ